MSASEPVSEATLEFHPKRLLIRAETDLRLGLSGAVLDGNTLWLACDEGCQIERLSRDSSGGHFTKHETFHLADLINLPAAASEEADIEGMDIDDGFLWFVGSHSLKRKKPKDKDAAEDVATKLTKLTRDGNRHVLGRIPTNGTALHRSQGKRRAASLPATKKSSALLEAIVPKSGKRADGHLAPFVTVPGKENGFDIEGLAVRGTRALVGLRGPVLREWCCILELDLRDEENRLRLAAIDGKREYRKHFLKLDGLGVRDLVILDDDLLILTGPSMAHDGPQIIWRWKGGAKPGSSPAEKNLERIVTLRARKGCDRAEAFTVFDHSHSGTSVLVVFDTPANERLPNKRSVLADIYSLA